MVLAAVASAGVAVLAWSGLQESVVYYRTPTEVLSEAPDPGQRLRLGGLVLQGSVQRSPTEARMVIADGVSEVIVVHQGVLPEIFTEGQGAVVEGFWGRDGMFHSERLMVRHSNEYRPAEGGAPRGGEAG